MYKQVQFDYNCIFVVMKITFWYSGYLQVYDLLNMKPIDVICYDIEFLNKLATLGMDVFR